MDFERLQKYLMLKNYSNYAKRFFGIDYHKSYAQNGEDILINFIFRTLGIQHPSYIDIGAHHPTHKSNTALLYATGSKGINIEANPILYRTFLKRRPRDINLNIGIGDKSGLMDFYILNNLGLSTFSKQEAERMAQEHGFVITKVIPVEVKTLGEVIGQYAGGVFPDLLSLDTEGLDETILRSIDFNKYRPKVICVETISFSPTRGGIKDQRLIDFLKQQGYLLIGDTYINSIFVDAQVWTE